MRTPGDNVFTIYHCNNSLDVTVIFSSDAHFFLYFVNLRTIISHACHVVTTLYPRSSNSERYRIPLPNYHTYLERLSDPFLK